MHFDGVSVDTLLAAAGPGPRPRFVLARSHTGYTTNLPLADVTGGQGLGGVGVRRRPAAGRARRPARLLVPHLYFWKSAKWVSGLELRTTTRRASGSATATTTAATPGSSSATRVTDGLPAAGPAGRPRGRPPRSSTCGRRPSGPRPSAWPWSGRRPSWPASTSSCASPPPTATGPSGRTRWPRARRRRADRPHRRAAGRRRGVRLPPRGRRARRPAGGAGPDRRLVRVGGRRAGAAGRRRLGDRPADVDAAPGPGQRAVGPGAAGGVGAPAGRPVLPRRAARPRGHRRLHREAPPGASRRPPAWAPPTCPRWSSRGRRRTCAAPPGSPRRPAACWWGWACRPAASGSSASAPAADSAAASRA